MATPCFSVRVRYRPVLEHHFAHLRVDASTLCGYICERHVVLDKKGRGHIAPAAGVVLPLTESTRDTLPWLQPVCLCRLGVLFACQFGLYTIRRTGNRMKFTVHEKQLKAQLGAAYDLSKYTEGVDYRRQKTGFGSRVMFRADIVDASSFKCNPSADLNAPSGESSDLNDDHIVLSVVDPSLVEHKQDKPPIIVPLAAVKAEEEPVITRPALLDGAVRTAKVVKKYQNQRFVETDTLGRVFVGSKGHQVKLNQNIQVKDGNLFMGIAVFPH